MIAQKKKVYTFSRGRQENLKGHLKEESDPKDPKSCVCLLCNILKSWIGILLLVLGNILTR